MRSVTTTSPCPDPCPAATAATAATADSLRLPRPARLRRLWQVLWAAVTHRPETLAGLRELDPRTLRDIGWCCGRDALPGQDRSAPAQRRYDFW